ncbi:MAG: hypothetical protein AABW58_00775 [Nanoarchaeota archaeon]
MIKQKIKSKVDSSAGKVIKWLDSKWWFLPKTATGFKVLLAFPNNKNIKKEFLDTLINEFGFYIDKQYGNSVALKKGNKNIIGPIRLANSLFSRNMKGWAHLIPFVTKLLPFLQRYGVEVEFKDRYARFIITPFMELFDFEERFIFSQDISESIADESYCRNYANKITKALEQKGWKKLKFKATGATWKEVWSNKERMLNKRKL